MNAKRFRVDGIVERWKYFSLDSYRAEFWAGRTSMALALKCSVHRASLAIRMAISRGELHHCLTAGLCSMGQDSNSQYIGFRERETKMCCNTDRRAVHS